MLAKGLPEQVNRWLVVVSGTRENGLEGGETKGADSSPSISLYDLGI